MKKTILLNAGHSKTDPGAIGLAIESELNQKIRDALIPELERQGFKVEVIPDILNLKESIQWVNQRAKNINDGLAFSIHQNCCGGVGAESYYYRTSQSSKNKAKKLIDAYCSELKLVNRGAKSSSSVRFGRLGWIEDTNCWAILIECGFIDNRGDVKLIKNYKKTAKAICKGINAVYGIPYKTEATPIIPSPQLKSREGIKNEIKKLVDLL